MELVPIIYNSLLLVFVLLSSVIVISLVCSKLNICGNSTDRKRANKLSYQRVSINRNEVALQPELNINSRINEDESFEVNEQPRIRKKLVDDNKVIVVKRAKEAPRFQIDQRAYSRYSVVNTMYREPNADREIYRKFSKMSVSYSQTA